MAKYRSSFEQYCPSCDEITTFRYLDCEQCHSTGKECIWICTKCGAEEPESPEHAPYETE